MEYAIRQIPSFLFAACLAAPGAADAQILLGNVIEEATKAVIIGAQLTLIDSDRNTIASAVSDSTGWFRLSATRGGQYTVRVNHIAYTEFISDPIPVGMGESVEIEVRMGRAVIPIDPITVTARRRENGRSAEFYQRLRTHNFGRFITRAEIEKRPHARVTDLLRAIPGISMVPVRQRGRSGPERYIIAMRGSPGACEPAIFVDGVRVRQQTESTLDEFLTPDMIEGVEVYTSTVGAPAQYMQSGACGVILFWTRQGETGEKFSWKKLLVGAGAIAAVILLLR